MRKAVVTFIHPDTEHYVTAWRDPGEDLRSYTAWLDSAEIDYAVKYRDVPELAVAA